MEQSKIIDTLETYQHPTWRAIRYPLEASRTWGPSLLDHVRSKNHAPEGFIPFGLRLIFLFFETLK